MYTLGAIAFVFFGYACFKTILSRDVLARLFCSTTSWFLKERRWKEVTDDVGEAAPAAEVKDDTTFWSYDFCDE